MVWLLLKTTIMFRIKFKRRGGVAAMNIRAPILHTEAIDICVAAGLTTVL